MWYDDCNTYTYTQLLPLLPPLPLLVRILALSLELPVTSLDLYFTDPLAVLRLLRYDTTVSDVSGGVMGCGAHSDYGCFTLLLTNEVNGLQIYVNDDGSGDGSGSGSGGSGGGGGEWRDIPPLGTTGFIVNIGDMLSRWTNDVYKSTVHRVVVSSGSSSGSNSNTTRRLSAPFFFEPNYDTIVHCINTTLLGESIYTPICSGEYLKEKYMTTHEDFKSEK